MHIVKALWGGEDLSASVYKPSIVWEPSREHYSTKEYIKKEYGLTDTRGRYYAKDEAETLVQWAQFQINGHLLGS